MGNLELILSLAGTAFSLLVMCVSFIFQLIRSVKKCAASKKTMALLDAVTPIVQIAETFTNYSGSEKKEYVLTKINQYAIENKIKFDAKAVSDKIEQLVDLSKQVNKRNTEFVSSFNKNKV